MGFFYEFPYFGVMEYNNDWLIAKWKELEARLNQEIQDRKDEDAKLLAAIEKEIADRMAADAELKEEFTELLGEETAARIAADNQLQANINTEAADREAADNRLQANINAEATAREAADAQLQKNLDAETEERKFEDIQIRFYIDHKIEEEEQTRQEADDRLQAAIDKEISDRETQDNALSAQISNEITARTQEDEALSDRIDAEASERNQADQDIHDMLDQLDAAYKAADAAEAQAREQAIADLDEKLNSCCTEVKGDITEINSSISTIYNDIAAITGASTTLASRVESLEQRADTSDLNLGATNARITTAEEEIKSNTDRVDEAFTEISNIDIRLMTTENTTSALQDNVNGLDTRVTALEAGGGGGGDVTKEYVDQQIEQESTYRMNADDALQSAINSNGTNIHTLQTEQSSMDARLETVEDSVANMVTTDILDNRLKLLFDFSTTTFINGANSNSDIMYTPEGRTIQSGLCVPSNSFLTVQKLGPYRCMYMFSLTYDIIFLPSTRSYIINSIYGEFDVRNTSEFFTSNQSTPMAQYNIHIFETKPYTNSFANRAMNASVQIHQTSVAINMEPKTPQTNINIMYRDDSAPGASAQFTISGIIIETSQH